MSYIAWFEAHALKHKELVTKLLERGMDKESIIEYFDFENMLEHEKEFCPLYTDKQKCHDIPSLNCYFCACPNFRFSDNGVKKVENKTQYSYCEIDSKDGSLGVYGVAIHQDCSKCSVPHLRSYVEKNFDLNWREAMQSCIVSNSL